MYDVILESLLRQERGLALLYDLLKQEYNNICDRKMTLVSHQEFSIQELIRQLVEEKEFVIRILKGIPLQKFAQSLADDAAKPLFEALERLDRAEQLTSRQATHNRHLGLGLLDQNSKSMDTLFKEAVPEVSLVYGRRGSMHTLPSQGVIISGRL